jgi:hypothetical protein
MPKPLQISRKRRIPGPLSPLKPAQTLLTVMVTFQDTENMQMLYDSESFVVVHVLPDAELQSMAGDEAGATPIVPAGIPTLTRHGFEIVDKRTGKEVYLDGSWAELFQQHISAWQANTPTQEEVEDTLDRYAELAQNPIVLH